MLKGFTANSQPILGNLLELSTLSQLRLCDIGVNILDDMYHGNYHGKHIHENDVEDVITRARSLGVHSMIFTGSNIEESKKTLTLCNTISNNKGLYCTVGIHPCNSMEFQNNNDVVIENLRQLIDEGLLSNKIVAIGNIYIYQINIDIIFYLI